MTAEDVLQSSSNLLNHLEPKSHSFAAKCLMRLKSDELPKLHTRVRFPSPAPITFVRSRRHGEVVLTHATMSANLSIYAQKRVMHDTARISRACRGRHSVAGGRAR